ncbi:MAG: hypothetical protein NTZ38_00750 [Candidatus Taylorbacteria bacterium]|nr:hypothetical protein [Candidatus Taylorbacteria bacterium]
MTNKTEKENKIPKIKVVWALLCRNASVDQASNMVSLFNILDELTLSKTPPTNNGVHSSKLEDFSQRTKVNTDFTLAVQFERDNMENVNGFEPKINVKIIDPAGEILADNELPIMFENDKKRMRAIINFDGILLTKSGNYTYIVATKSTKDEKFKEQSKTTIDIKIFA